MVVVRLCLLLVGWFSQILLPNPRYPVPEALARGWHYSQSRLLDIWARWDSGWYFGIIRRGYALDENIQSTMSDIAFFPLYPYLIKLFVFLLPERMQTTERLLIIGLLISNVLLIAALVLLHKLVTSLFDRETAQRTILYTLLFPTGFFLFCFYTESTFLFLSVAAFYAAQRRAWGAACLCGALLALTRPPGILISVPLFWMYLESIEWKPARLRPNVLYFLLIPAALLSFFLYAQRLTGDFLAPVHAQQAWNKRFAMPWTTLFNPYGGDPYVTSVEQVLTVAFIALAVLALFKLSSPAYAIYSFLLIIPPLLSGTLISTSRYYLVVFPAFILLARFGKHPLLDNLIKITLFTLQLLFMLAWARFYWVA
jgi:hypothetical protein